ncbi:MAG: CbiX/SirB N-terminal domain-containing protein [Akkermansiaceae bacterium]|nr:CbiX/SirB N-terminal domain-containing protein [Armatimonadota bacterium]
MKNALLVLVHGSPRPVANETMFQVVETLRTRPEVKEKYPIVAVGFMECNEPTIPDAIDQCVTEGAVSVTAVPYFLHTGTHVCDDLPTLLEEAQTRHPHVTFRMADYLGLSPRMTDLLITRADAVK